MNKLLFLGGTCGKNNWRIALTDSLVNAGVPADNIFDPVVEHWDKEAQEREEYVKANCSHLLFYLASPYTEGNALSAYSMVEATMALYDRPDVTVVVFDPKDIEGHSLKSFYQTERVLRIRFPKARIFGSVNEATEWLAAHLK